MYSCHYLQLDLLEFAMFGCVCALTGIYCLIQQVLSLIILALCDSKVPGALLFYQDRLLGSCKGHSSSTCLVINRSNALGQ